MSTTTQPPKPKRRWYQFSLRTLLVVMTLACVAFAWTGWRIQQARVNRDGLAAAQKTVDTAIEKAAEERAAIMKLGGWLEPKIIHRRPQTWLEKVFFDSGGPDDPADDWILWAYGGVSFGDADLKHFSTLTVLHVLTLDDSNVTDAGLMHLKGLTDLESLFLDGTKVTDAGLEHLKGLTSLLGLFLSDTEVTDEGVEKLQQALPNCTIQFVDRLRQPSPPHVAELPSAGDAFQPPLIPDVF